MGIYIRILLFVIILLPFNSYSQYTFQRSFGGNSDDYGTVIQETRKGGYFIIGVTNNAGLGSSDIFIMKLDSLGRKEIFKTLGGSSSESMFSLSKVGANLTRDGGLIICGQTKSYSHGNFDAYLVKTNDTGKVEWSKTFGGNSDDGFIYVDTTSDKGYITIGLTKSYGKGGEDVIIVKVDSTGKLLWSKTYGGSNDDFGEFVREDVDKGYLITGATESSGQGKRDIYVLKVKQNEKLGWDKTYGGTKNETGRFIEITSDTNYILGSDTWTFGTGGADWSVISIDNKGSVNWSRAYGGTANDGLRILRLEKMETL